MDEQRLLVLSDTHGNVPALQTVFKWVQNNCIAQNAIGGAAFLGDGIEDLHRAAAYTGFSCEWKMVRGNNDYAPSVPEAACLDFGGKRFFLCHGHRYALYDNCDTLVAAAKNMKADAVLFGHIHAPFFEEVNGILLINPGSVSRPRTNAGATFAIIECPPGNPLKAEFWEITTSGKIREAHFR